ncbi:hypothetical protein DA2_3211 [Desulfovibrio sp. A2]|nr:hypothetical protein DA2_3211 [Desulfovibrio sp. A2]
MGLFDWLFGKRKDPAQPPADTATAAQEPSVQEGTEPAEVFNRPEIKWNDWNKRNDVHLGIPDLPVAGVTHVNNDGVGRQNILRHMRQWEAVDIIPEPDNPHDPNALRIMAGMGQIGYIPKEQAAIIADWMRHGWGAMAKLSALYGGEGKPYGAKIDMLLTQPPNTPAEQFKICGIRGRDRVEVAQSLEPGDRVDITSGDADGEYTVARDWEEFGKLSKADARVYAKHEGNGATCYAFVSDVEPNEDEDKPPHVTVVAVFCQP